MKRQSRIFFFLFLLNIFSGYSIDGLRFENITTKNGLSQNTIRCMIQDKRGFMWVGTMNGLNRYDGREFIVMLPEFGKLSLAENRIKSITEGQNGLLWILTNSDIVDCYDTRLETFVDYIGNGATKNYRNILVAQNGDVWLWGAQDGCCRVRYVDGKLETKFFNKDNIKSNSVNFIHEGSDKSIWIGTDIGLLQYINNDINTCEIGCSKAAFQSAIELGTNIYFFTNNNKIVVFDKLKKKRLYDVIINPEDRDALKINQTCVLDEYDSKSKSKILITTRQSTFVFDINMSKIIPAASFFGGRNITNAYFFTDNKGGIWVYNKSGNIWQYKPESKTFREYKLIPETIMPLIDFERFTIHHDSRNIIWITTYGNGLFALDQNTGEVSHFTQSNSGLKTDYLLSITEDNSGEIWIGTEYAGISKILMTNYKNKVFYPDKDKTNSSHKVIRTILEDRNGDIWVGTKSGNIYVVDKDLNNKKILNMPKGMPYVLAEDTAGNKWVGTKGSGLLIYSAVTHTNSETYINSLTNNASLPNNNIYAILCDSKGRMWLGTFGGGLLLCERGKDGKLTFRKFSDANSRQSRIRCIMQDRNGLIWIGGNKGVTVFDPDKLLANGKDFANFSFDGKDDTSLNNNEVKTVFEDSNGNIWIGTSGGGLNLVIKGNPLNNTQFKHYSSSNGLTNDVVQTILEDNDKNLWVSTESGISKFNLITEAFENYSFSNVWEGDLFCESSCFKRKNGELMFGSYDGMYIFNPSSFENRSYMLPVTLTNFRINGNQVRPNDKDSPLEMSISETKKIRLTNDQNSFSIEFASLNFLDPYSNRYSYILEGYEKEWNPATRYNAAIYRNIPPGTYTFKVKGCNASGVWNDNETILDIVVVPPIWKSSYAMISYMLLIIVAIFFILRLTLKMNKLHTAVEVEKQLTDYRLRFFTNISHEFRTPLTIIRGTIENLITTENLPATAIKHIKTLDKSSSRLLQLINQLLEFRRLQNNKMELNLEHTEVVAFFRDIYTIFTETAEKKKIDFSFHTNEESKMILLDRGKMDKVAYNLLSNAFKYTPEKGKVKMELIFDEGNDTFVLRVSDSGIGIPKEKQEMLFVRFKQINYSSSGTGIGLHLTSELVYVHKGNIVYSDSEGGGACFAVALSLSGDIYDKEDIVESVESKMGNSLANNELTEEEIASRTLKNYNILVIEDDDEVRDFLKDQLEEYFTVITAENGMIGIEKAAKYQPNLIVCDVMMPELDGFEVTRRLKADFNSSHIPIILLTAHSSPEHQLEGIEAGADAYITKPFSMKYLMARVVKLIEQREKLQQKFTKEPGLVQPTICSTDKDKEFLEKIHEIIEENLTNPDFSVDQFAQTVQMGRTVFYKKIKGITGYSPNEYLRVIRMKKAAELLSTTSLNVSEVSYRVGINDPFYFSKCFKMQFGKSPTQYLKGN